MKENQKANIVCFETKSGNKYIYDVCSNLFFRGSELLSDMLKLYKKKQKEDLIKSMSLKHNSYKAVIQCYSFVDDLFKNYSCFFQDKFPDISLTRDVFEKKHANVTQLILEITQNCNFRCKYCIYSGKYNNRRLHKDLSMSYEIAKKGIDYYYSLATSKKRTIKSNKLVFGFYGGEPLLEFPLIKKCIEYIKKKNNHGLFELVFLITTNGSLLNERIINYSIENNIRINISLDGPKDIHDLNRVFKNGKGSFDKIWKNIVTIKKINRKFYSNNILYQSALSPEYDIYKLINFFNNKKYFRKNILNISPLNMQEDTSLKIKEHPDFRATFKYFETEYIRSIISGSYDSNSLFINSLFRDMFKKLINNSFYTSLEKKEQITVSCIPGCSRLFLSANGKYHTCERINHYFPIGDYKTGVKYKRVKRIWSEYIETVLKNCAKCKAIHNCNICIASAANKGYFKVDSLCQVLNKDFSFLIREYFSILEDNPEAFKTFEHQNG